MTLPKTCRGAHDQVLDDVGPGTSRSDRARRHFVPLLLGIAAGGLVVRVAYVLVVMPRVSLGQDAIWYRLQASMIAGGVGYVDPAELLSAGRVVPTAQFPPMWPALLALADLLGADTVRSSMLVGAAIGSVTVVLAGLVGREVADERVGLVAAALTATSLRLVTADGSLMSETLFTALLTGAVLVAIRAARGNAVRWWVVLGAMLGLATLTRSDGMILAPVVVAATVLGSRRPIGARRALLAMGSCAAAFVVVVTPWAVERTTALDDVVLVSSNSGGLLEGANCDEAYRGDGIGLWHFECTTRRGEHTELEHATIARRRGVEYAFDHRTQLPAVGAVRVLRTWGLYDPIGQARAEAVETRSTGWLVGAWAAALPLLAVAVVGVVVARRDRRPIAPLLGVIVGVTVVGLVSWGNQRFRVAAEPQVAVLAAIGAVAIVQRIFVAAAPSAYGEVHGEPLAGSPAAPT